MNKSCILMPLFNDWKSASRLIKDIDQVVRRWDSEVTALISNDGSTEPLDRDHFLSEGLENIARVEIIHLSRNMGHQRAIATGLAYAQSRGCYDRVYVMDSDGEDSPHDLETLRSAGDRYKDTIVNAERSSRSEGFAFRLFYKLYRLLFFLLTGTDIKFGNFCMIPKSQLGKLLHYPDLWNSFSGCMKKAAIPKKGVPTNRALRYFGSSKMNFNSLALHGLSVISVFRESALLRLLILSVPVTAILGLALLASGSVFSAVLFTGGVLVSLNLLAHLLCVLKERGRFAEGPALYFKENISSAQTLWESGKG